LINGGNMATTSTTDSWKTSMPDTGNLEDVRSKLTDLYNTIGQTYTELTNSGREAEAAQLREAADRFAKIGSQYGANAFVRQASLQDLANKFRVAGQSMESGNATKKISEQLSVLNALANVSSNVFEAAMSKAKMLQTDDQQQRQDSLSRMQINAALQAQAQQRAAASQNKLKQQSIMAQAQNRGAPVAPAVDPFKRAEASTFTANLNSTNRTNSGAIGAINWTQTGGVSGAPMGGVSPGQNPWYTMPAGAKGVNVPAAPAPNIPLGGSTGGAANPPGATGPQVKITGNPSGIQDVVDPITGLRRFINAEKPVAPGTPTPATVAAKKGAAAAPLATSPGSVWLNALDNVSNTFGKINNALKPSTWGSALGNWYYGNK